MPATTFPATNEDGQNVNVTIDADPAAGTAHVTSTDGEDGTLTGVTVSPDGKTIKGKAKIGPFKGPATVTIDCDAVPPTVTVVVEDPIFGVTIKTIVYTITHATQDKLIAWIKKLKPQPAGGGKGGAGGAKRKRPVVRRPARRRKRNSRRPRRPRTSKKRRG